MKISIVMATYNGEKYIQEQIDSIFAKTRQADEVLFFDDGSTDKTPQIVKSFIEKHNLKDTWKFEKNRENKGYILNFLDGADKATGDVIFYADQDDIWDYRKLELMEQGFLEHSDMKACYCLRHFINADGSEIPMRHAFMTNVKVRTNGFQKVSMNEAVKYNKSPGLCLAIKKGLITETRKMILENNLTHDLPIGTVAAIYNGYYVLNQKLVYYRQHGRNISAARVNLKSRMSRIDKQIDGRQGRLDQMEAIYKSYFNAISNTDRKNLLKAINSTRDSIKYLKGRKLGKLFISIFNTNPMMNNWIAVNNFMICFWRSV